MYLKYIYGKVLLGDKMRYYMHISSILDDMISDVAYIKGETIINSVKNRVKS